MKLIARVKLQPRPEQHALLLQTLEAANAACNHVSEVAWQQRVFGQFALHKLCYTNVRAQFGLGADVAVRVFAKVADGYKLDKEAKRTFKPHGAFPFNDRLVSYKLDKRIVSIATLDGRQKMPFVCGEHQAKLLEGLRGECDLVYRKGEFYLYQCCDVDEPPTEAVDDYLGVDLGVTNIAVDSDRTIHQGKAMKGVRYRHRKLQAKGTKGTRRRLKKLAGKEQRFAKDVNHVISKHIVAKAKDTARGIALEDLKGIRERVTASAQRAPAQRATLSSWSFAQLRAFIEYKAKQMGVPVVAVDPRNTSRTCPCCGHIDKANRRTQDSFLCVQCGYSGLADHIAALNISRRALLSAPNVSDVDATFYPQRQGQTPLL